MSSSHVDRNLLFGFLALQNNFIAREELIAAVSVWLVDKKQPLEEILRSRRSLADDEHQLVSALARKHLERHGNDAEKSLATLSSMGALREDLKRLGDTEIEASLAHVATAAPIGAPGLAATLPPDPSAKEKTRFRILRPHAEGGLGQVFVACDEELNREVALKEIKYDFARDLESRSRFVLEAEITGGLEHPGVVPVYGVGQYSDGRPFYAMRFIRGDNLGKAVERFHAGVGGTIGGSTKQPVKKGSAGLASGGTEDANVGVEGATGRAASYDSVEFRQLLGRFVDVCNAIEYAHSRGVLHRDLKPGNIMLGKYGETLVVDWGLAKTQGKGEQHQQSEEQTLQPRSGNDSAATQMGMAKGTPEYMSPEQAAGRLDELGPAADVYSLGATLYYVLTGRAPFDREGGIGATLARVQAGEFAPPRTINAKVPKALEAICLKAMRSRPLDRYSSPQLFADDVERFLADQPTVAFREPPFARARRWVREHPAVAATTAATLLLGSLFLAALVVFVGRANQRLDTANSQLASVNGKLEETNTRLVSTNQSLDKANTDLNAANGKLDEAVKTAHEQNKLALDTIDFVVFQVDIELGKIPGAGGVRKALLNGILERVKQVSDKYQSPASIDQRSAAALLKLGDLCMRISASPRAAEEPQADAFTASATTSARKLFEQARDIFQRLAEADPGDSDKQRNLSVSYEKLGMIAIQEGNLLAASKAFEQGLKIAKALAKIHAGSSRAQLDLSISYENIGFIAMQEGSIAAARKAYEESMAICKRVAESDPRNREVQLNLSVRLVRLVDIAIQDGDLSTARKYCEQGLEIVRRLAEAEPENWKVQRHASVSYQRLGNIAMQEGNFVAAKMAYDQNLVIFQRLAESDPFNVEAQRDLSVVYSKLGKIAAKDGNIASARKNYEQSVEIAKRLADADPENSQAEHDLSLCYSLQADNAVLEGDYATARKIFEQKAEIAKRRAEADPRNHMARREHAISCEKLGDVAMQEGQIAIAKKAYEQFLEIASKLAESDPRNGRAQRDLSISYSKLGNIAVQNGDLTAAQNFYQRDLTISQRLVAADPLDSQAQRDLSSGYDKVGDIAIRGGDLAAARKYYEQSLEICQRLAAADPRGIQAQRNLSVSYIKLGDITSQEGDLTAAGKVYEQALEICQRLAAADPGDSQAQRDLSVSYLMLGDIGDKSGDLIAACNFYAQALEIRERSAAAKPRDSEAQSDLSVILIKLGAIALSGKHWAKASEQFEAGKRVLVGFRERTGSDIFQSRLEAIDKLIAECRKEMGK